VIESCFRSVRGQQLRDSLACPSPAPDAFDLHGKGEIFQNEFLAGTQSPDDPPMRRRSDENMAEILPEPRQQNRFQLAHFKSARPFDEEHGQGIEFHGDGFALTGFGPDRVPLRY
jgi:hypothetical protein